MYQHIFDYDKEFGFYDAILKRNNCQKILEVACGSGMLARRFIDHGYDYYGVDLFNEMLEIARSEAQSDRFIQCDMRSLAFNNQFDAVLITGRSIAYIIENQGIQDTLVGVSKSLKNNGILVFDIFEASGIFDNFNDFEQNFQINDRKIKRVSKLKMNLSTGWTYDWHAKYIIEHNGETTEYDDITTLRAFTKDEISLFLKLTGFKIKEIIEEPKTFTIIAEK
jgi:SAM-dependent methyltransferase